MTSMHVYTCRLLKIIYNSPLSDHTCTSISVLCVNQRKGQAQQNREISIYGKYVNSCTLV